MSKKYRERLVELLRCAADHNDDETGIVGIFGACGGLDADGMWKDAIDARHHARADGPTDYRHTCLEAALRVEQGLWP